MSDAPPSPDSFAQRLREPERWHGPSARPWKAYALQVLAFAAAGLLLYGIAVAAINPRGEFPWQPMAPVSSEDPAYKDWLLHRQPAPPEVLVLGSSRSQKVAPADVTAASNLTAFNFAIADAYPEDALRIYDGLRGGLHPKEIILGLDLNRLQPQEAAAERTRTAFGPLHRPGASAGDWAAAFGHLYTDLYARQAGQSVLEATGVVGDGLIGFDDDGLAHYVPWETAIAHGTFNQSRTIDQFIRGRTGYPPYAGLDDGHVAAVRALVAQARADNVTVRVWLTPVHPRVEASYGNDTYPLYKAAGHDLLASLCAPGVHAYDYTDLGRFGGRPEWFFDGSHSMRQNTQAAVHAMYAGSADLCP